MINEPNLAKFIKQQFTCRQVLENAGHQMVSSKGDEDLFLCPFHEDKKPSFQANRVNGLWKCWAGCGRGSVIDLMAKLEGIDPKVWLSRRAKENIDPPKTQLPSPSRVREEDNEGNAHPFEEKPLKSPPNAKSKIAETYDYHDANGKLVYQAVRMDPKDFRQRRPVGEGKWAWDMEGIERVLYRLPEVRKSKEVWIVEGEKDVQQLVAVGICATTNVGGANKWLESYGEHLKGKDLVICGDNDVPGQKHVELVQSMCERFAASIRVVKVPLPSKDISDHLEGMSDGEAMEACQKLRDIYEPLFQGETLPLYQNSELEVIYRDAIRADDSRALKFGNWLPSMSEIILVPGEMFCVIAETGVGKTSVLTNIALHNPKLKTIYFQQELSARKVFERNLSTATGVARADIRHAYKNAEGVDWKTENKFGHVWTCVESGLTLPRLESIARRSELKTGTPPDLILLDYIQLTKGAKGQNRYDRFTDVAEGLRVLAKNLNCVIGLASQVVRNKERGYKELLLTDGKDSGAIENSSSLMLGFTRNPDNKSEMCCQVLKASDFGADLVVLCHYDFPTMRIKEKPPTF